MKSIFGITYLMKTVYSALLALALSFLLYSCVENAKPSEKDIVKQPELFPDRLKKNMQELLEYSFLNSGRINDTTLLTNTSLIRQVYSANEYAPIWSAEGKWIALGDSLNYFLDRCRQYGLFPSDYNYRAIVGIRNQIQSDTLSHKDAALWSRAEMLMTDALLKVSEHLKRGRLPYDSVSRKDTFQVSDSFHLAVVRNVMQEKRLLTILDDLQPKIAPYRELVAATKLFLDSTELKEYTLLPYPYQDSVSFYQLLRNRLYEEGIMDSMPQQLDSITARRIISKYQASKKLKVTGKINENTVKMLNDTPWERFKRIALTLDKYKLLPDTLPHTYVWVNIPSFNLKVYEEDTLVFESRVIVGSSKTRTPELNSEISNFITYPQWTVPYSIIFKEMLPAIQKDINYLAKQNLIVVDRYDSVVDPATIDWSKLSKKKFPYEIKQREGDDNSLGVIKFNFRNKYSVYLHDTNVRWMFQKSGRALSHGCVRVQDWQELAHFLVRNDTVKYHTDTLASWIVRQEKHVVSGFKKIPLFIRYHTCEARDGRVRFYDDVYGDDKVLTDKYFAKNIY
jgi:murein L,D-transpeptidase YcbB/YkuD